MKTTRKNTTPRATAAALPHSWLLKDWPAGIAPGTTQRAKHFIKQNRDSLMALGALGRVGRDIVVFGAGYGAFLARSSAHVEGYDISQNLGTRLRAAAQAA